MKHGVLAACKKRYQCRFLLSPVIVMDKGCDMVKKLKEIQLLDITDWIVKSWNELELVTYIHTHTEVSLNNKM